MHYSILFEKFLFWWEEQWRPCYYINVSLVRVCFLTRGFLLADGVHPYVSAAMLVAKRVFLVLPVFSMFFHIHIPLRSSQCFLDSKPLLKCWCYHCLEEFKTKKSKEAWQVFVEGYWQNHRWKLGQQTPSVETIFSNISLKNNSWNLKKFQLIQLIQVLYMSFDRFLLAVESRDLCRAGKSIIWVSSFPS